MRTDNNITKVSALETSTVLTSDHMTYQWSHDYHVTKCTLMLNNAHIRTMFILLHGLLHLSLVLLNVHFCSPQISFLLTVQPHMVLGWRVGGSGGGTREGEEREGHKGEVRHIVHLPSGSSISVGWLGG